MTGASDTDAAQRAGDRPQGLALLRGIRVIDFTQALSGPFRTMMPGFVNICVGNDAQFVRPCAALDLAHMLGREHSRTNPQRQARQAQLLDLLGSALRDIPSADVTAEIRATVHDRRQRGLA